MDRDEILLDCIQLDSTDPAENAKIVSDTEQRRAARYRHALDSRRFLARRAQTRLILAEMLRVPAQEIAFSVNAFGKPYIQGSTIRFSTSHSQGLLLIAIGTDRELGCDIEYCDPNRELALFVPMTFTDTEMLRFDRVQENLKVGAFYDRWTCKEAYLKAIGTGLSIPMTDFSIMTGPFRIVTESETCADWSARSWCPRADYRAAIVARGKDWHIKDR
ncbi:4'-phosphopantetheinyl transferase family protein [Sphingomonas oryzagri]